MQSKDAIFKHLQELMVELFEADANAIKPDSKLYEDLDIDSIDAVDLAVRLKQMTGLRLQPEVFKQIRTIDDVIEALSNLKPE